MPNSLSGKKLDTMTLAAASVGQEFLGEIHVTQTRFRRELKKWLAVMERGTVVIVTRRGEPVVVAIAAWLYEAVEKLSARA